MIATLSFYLRQFMGRLGFRSRAALVLVASFIFFAGLTAVIIPLLTSWVMSSGESNEGEKITSSFARQATLALIYKSAENGKDAIVNVMEFPGIVYVAIYDDKNMLIAGNGNDPDHWDQTQYLSTTSMTEARLAYETDDNWHFLGPVTTLFQDSQFSATPVKNEYLGYVHIVRSKASLRRLRTTLLSYIALITPLSLVVALILLSWLTNLLLRPVRALSNTLEDAGFNSTPIRAAEAGPPEIVDMARAFNRLMTQLEERDHALREHSNLLETNVQLRTNELVQARDLALSANRQKSEFVAMIGHELRTPLQSVIGYTDDAIQTLELRGKDDADAVADLKIAMQAADKLITLINDLLDFSKIEAGSMSVDWSDVDIRALVEDAIRTVMPLARLGQNKINTVYDCPKSQYLTDQQKLLQILLNLLSNACKFTKGGKISVCVACMDDFLVLSVTDTGRGIPVSDQGIIFDAFRQSRSQDNHPGGAGLGLAVTSRLCALLGGAIDVESAVGQGATFTVRLPIRRAHEDTASRTQSEP